MPWTPPWTAWAPRHAADRFHTDRATALPFLSVNRSLLCWSTYIMDLRKLKTLIDLVSESNVSELEITEADGKVRIVKAGAAPVVMMQQPMQAQQPQPVAAAPDVAAAPVVAEVP